MTALLAMHASCASGVTVVGIDNGFGAACAIARIMNGPNGMTARIAWFNCQAGVAGDMTMAALVDAGADPDVVGRTIAGLGVDGYALMFERVQRGGIGATWANVVVHDHVTRPRPRRARRPRRTMRPRHRPPVREIIELLDAADLPERVRARARAVFVRLGEVEGAIHGVDPADVELHEVGSLDSIVDVVGACAALESLDIDEIWCGPIGLGTGTIRSAHGLIPNPAPATMRLLDRRRRADRRARRDDGNGDADRCGADDDARQRLRTGPGDDAHGGRIRRRHRRSAATVRTSCRS